MLWATPVSPLSWHVEMKDSGEREHPNVFLRTQALGLTKRVTHPCHWDKEGNSEVLLNLLFKTQNVSAPKTTGFLFGGRRMPFKEKEYTLQISLEGKSVGETIECQDLSTGFPPKRLPAVEQRWPVQGRVSGPPASPTSEALREA